MSTLSTRVLHRGDGDTIGTTNDYKCVSKTFLHLPSERSCRSTFIKRVLHRFHDKISKPTSLERCPSKVKTSFRVLRTPKTVRVVSETLRLKHFCPRSKLLNRLRVNPTNLPFSAILCQWQTCISQLVQAVVGFCKLQIRS